VGLINQDPAFHNIGLTDQAHIKKADIASLHRSLQ